MNEALKRSSAKTYVSAMLVIQEQPFHFQTTAWCFQTRTVVSTNPVTLNDLVQEVSYKSNYVYSEVDPRVLTTSILFLDIILLKFEPYYCVE